MPRWTFSYTFGTYEFEVSPNEGGSPHMSRRYDRAQPTAPTGNFGHPITFEGRPEAPSGSFSGVARSETHVLTLISWYQDKPIITVTDDLGRVFKMVPGALQMSPDPTSRAPWRHKYTFSYAVIDPAAVL